MPGKRRVPRQLEEKIAADRRNDPKIWVISDLGKQAQKTFPDDWRQRPQFLHLIDSQEDNPLAGLTSKKVTNDAVIERMASRRSASDTAFLSSAATRSSALIGDPSSRLIAASNASKGSCVSPAGVNRITRSTGILADLLKSFGSNPARINDDFPVPDSRKRRET